MSWKIDNGDELVVGTVIMGLLIVGLLKVTRRRISGKLSNSQKMQRWNGWPWEVVSAASLGMRAGTGIKGLSFGTVVEPCDLNSLLIIKFPYMR